MLQEIKENLMIDQIVKNFQHSPVQIHQTHEADAELVEIGFHHPMLLAITMDSVAEEVTTGLYQDPYTMDWVTIMSNFSDLAAVGADPLGIVVSISTEPTREEDFLQRLAQGMAAACRKLRVHILGGDMNTTRSISLTGCAVGFVPRDKIITRIGCQTGDVVFLSGRAGIGSAIGLVRFAKLSEDYFPENLYRPVARIREGQIIRKYATCCMDTSDGVLATFDQLMRLNQKGFKVSSHVEKFLHPRALKISTMIHLPAWTLLAGHHGEFELLFTVHPDRVEEFWTDAVSLGWHPLKIGSVIEKPALVLATCGKCVILDTGEIRNLFVECNGDINNYIKKLINFENVTPVITNVK